VLERLVKKCDVLVENFAPGALDRMGLTWEHIQSLNPRMIVASVKGFGPGRTRTARCTRTSRSARAARRRRRASTTARRSSPARRSATRDGLHLALGIVAALYQRNSTGAASEVLAAMQDGVLNLCRVKLRDQQRLDRTKVMEEYPQYPKASSAMPFRAPAMHRAADSRVDPEVQGLGDRSQRVHLLHHAGAGVEGHLRGDRRREWLDDPRYATPKARCRISWRSSARSRSGR
jgi:formyl-CoA transferase